MEGVILSLICLWRPVKQEVKLIGDIDVTLIIEWLRVLALKKV